MCRVAVSATVGVCRGCDEAIDAALARLPPPTGSAFWLGPYAGPWLRLVHALKFSGESRLADYLGGKLAVRCATGTWRPTLVTHVPGDPARVAARGYDQARSLATAAAAALDVEHVTLLTRRSSSVRQAQLGRAARALNASSSFRSRYAPGRVVLLVDDVMTTGATAAACSAALLAAGAAEVRTAVVARTSGTGER